MHVVYARVFVCGCLREQMCVLVHMCVSACLWLYVRLCGGVYSLNVDVDVSLVVDAYTTNSERYTLNTSPPHPRPSLPMQVRTFHDSSRG